MNKFNIHSEGQGSIKEKDFENALRPLSFNDFNGQNNILENLKVFVKAARLRANLLTTPSFTVLQD